MVKKYGQVIQKGENYNTKPLNEKIYRISVVYSGMDNTHGFTEEFRLNLTQIEELLTVIGGALIIYHPTEQFLSI